MTSIMRELRRSLVGLACAVVATAAAAGATTAFALFALRAWSEVSGAGWLASPVWPLVGMAAAVGTVVALRLTVTFLVTCVALVSALAGAPSSTTGRWALAVSPRAVRPTVALLLAGALAVAAAGPSAADTPPSPTAVNTTALSNNAELTLPAPDWSALPRPGWRPTATRTAAAASGPAAAADLVTAPARRGSPDDEVVVRSGDTLWHLAARSLGPGATAAEIAAQWPSWWHANRAVIGPDPDLLVPGTRLRAPDRTT